MKELEITLKVKIPLSNDQYNSLFRKTDVFGKKINKAKEEVRKILLNKILLAIEEHRVV